jgi:hypothetical protein
VTDPRFQIIETGEATTADDPKRGVWYAANELCGYWTDDWSKLGRAKFVDGRPVVTPPGDPDGDGIPCCPTCGLVGMQTNFADWDGGARAFEESGHPGYHAYVQHRKERCARRRYSWMEGYAAHLRGEDEP